MSLPYGVWRGSTSGLVLARWQRWDGGIDRVESGGGVGRVLAGGAGGSLFGFLCRREVRGALEVRWVRQRPAVGMLWKLRDWGWDCFEKQS